MQTRPAVLAVITPELFGKGVESRSFNSLAEAWSTAERLSQERGWSQIFFAQLSSAERVQNRIKLVQFPDH